MDYKESVDYVCNIPRYKKKTNQDVIRRVLEILGRPDNEYKTIHIVGTNGKGSVSAYLNSIGQHFGYKMGMFTSPHLIDIRERFQVNNQLIAEEDFVRLLGIVIDAEKQAKEEGLEPLTFFEVIFAIGMLHFKEQGVDYAIVEAGMGGRSDSTNVLDNPVVTVVTSIGMDHAGILGDTIEKIAYEKIGAARINGHIVIGPQKPKVREIIEDYVSVVGGHSRYVDNHNRRILDISKDGIEFGLDTKYGNEVIYKTKMFGAYQVDNASTAIFAARTIFRKPYEDYIQPVSETLWPGRMEEVAPNFYVDGAHNAEAFVQFTKTIKACFAEVPKIIIYAAANDKDDKTMLKNLLQIPIKILVVTELSNGRKKPASEIVKLIDELIANENLNAPQSVIVEPNINQAIAYAREFKEEDDYIFGVGSLYLVSDIKRKVQIDK